jgi:alginate biosynthesis protein AlgX
VTLRAAASATLLGLMLMAGHAAADTAHGCTGLGGHHRWSSVEGAAGTFFRLDPDLMMTHPFSDDSVEGLARLSRALAAGGTRLVYVPLPTKGMALPARLPPEARDLGYDATLAATLYDDTIARLAAVGVSAVNARAALRSADDAAPSFFAADPRLTPAGARRTAEAVAATMATLPGLSDLPRARFETRATGRTRLPSPMRTALQRHCLIPLPEVEAETFATTRLDGGTTGTGSSALLGGGPQARVALVGTEDAVDPALNLAGFLATATGLEVQAYAVTGGGAFAAISSYLTSHAFAGARPAVLVWVNPVSESLASHGDQPLRELIAAAGDSCRRALPTGPGLAPDLLIADLSAMDPATPAMLLIDAGGAAAARVTVEVRGPGGPARLRTVQRHRNQAPTGRFYVPLDSLWPASGAAGAVADIRLDVPFGPGSAVTACPDAPTGGP